MKVSKRTSAWSKAVKKRLIDLDMSIYDLADKLEMSNMTVEDAMVDDGNGGKIRYGMDTSSRAFAPAAR